MTNTGNVSACRCYEKAGGTKTAASIAEELGLSSIAVEKSIQGLRETASIGMGVLMLAFFISEKYALTIDEIKE